MQDKSRIFNKALKLQLSGKAREAQKLYLKLVKQNKNNDKLFFLLGTSYLQTDEYDKAINYLDVSIKINPNFQDAFNNRGIALTKKKRYQESIKDYDAAINLKKDFFDAYLNKGISLRNIDQKKFAIECFEVCIKLNPGNSKIYNNLGNVYKDLKKYSKAVECFNKAIKLNENYAEAYYSRGTLFQHYNHINLAVNDYEKVVKLKKNFDFIYGDLLHAKMHICDWNNYDSLKKKIETEININKKIIRPFGILSLTDDQHKHKIVSENFSKYLFHNLPDRTKINLSNNSKIKIGYFSGDFRKHAVLGLILDVFKNHDHSKFQIYGFYHGEKEDEYTAKAKKYFHKFFNVFNYTEEQIAELSRKEKVDIAIDLCGYTKHAIHKTYYYQAAPIQINYLGYPGTMGNKFYDYIITDKNILPPEEFKNFSEKIIYLPHCYQANQYKVKISDKNFSKKDFDLPEHHIIFGCLNSNYKINPKIFDCWMNILIKCQKSILWILKEDEQSSVNLVKEAKKRGIDKHRLIFANKTSSEVHLKRLKFIDLYLDTFPYGAHTTASEAIRMGIPVLTIMGKSFASRVASSILINVGLSELITNNSLEYTNTAIDLAMSKNKIKNLKNHLKNQKNLDNLFNSKRFTKDLENIFLKLVKNRKI